MNAAVAYFRQRDGLSREEAAGVADDPEEISRLAFEVLETVWAPQWFTAATACKANHHVALAADRLFGAEAEHLAVERPNDRLICVTVRLDMDPGPNALPDHIRWSPERMRRLISSLICSSSKAANRPKPTISDKSPN